MPAKIFRDPLYNYISIDKDRDDWLLQLLDCPEVQRLRRIHQLGVSNITYPGADHNRLAHSLGVVHLMRMALDHLGQSPVSAQLDSARQALLAAALLHDVGHGPFSHLFEPCLGIKHEQWSIRVILEDSEVHEVLVKQSPYLPRQIADLVESDNYTPPSWQKALLSSQLDMDRVDYLRRDSLFTGAGYGHFDWFRLLTTVEIDGNTKEGFDLVWPEKAAMAIEEYIFARYYMYQNVYLHKTTRGFEKLLEAMWRRAKKLRADGEDVSLVPVLDEFWTSTSQSIQQYLNIEEFTVLSQIQIWANHQDSTLADLARRFLSRDGFAAIEPPSPKDELKPDYSEWEDALGDLLVDHGYKEPGAYGLADTLEGKYRRPYRPEKESKQQSASNAIRLRVAGATEPVEVSDYLPRLKALTQPVPDRRRYYVPKDVRKQAQDLASTMK